MRIQASNETHSIIDYEVAKFLEFFIITFLNIAETKIDSFLIFDYKIFSNFSNVVVLASLKAALYLWPPP